MPEGINTFVEDGFATIDVDDPVLRNKTLGVILEHTPAELVQTNTRTGPHRTYTIPEGNARDAGLIDGEGVRPPIDRHDQGHSAALTEAYEQEKADDHHHYLPTVAEHSAAPLSQRTVSQSDVNNPEPEVRDGIVTGPLRPNKRVDGNVPQPPAGASTTAAGLQAKIKASTPRPADYAPDYGVSLDERTPSGTLITGQPSQSESGVSPDIDSSVTLTQPTFAQNPDTDAPGFDVADDGGDNAGDDDDESDDSDDSATPTDGTDPAPAPVKKVAAKKAPAKKAAPRKTAGS